MYLILLFIVVLKVPYIFPCHFERDIVFVLFFLLRKWLFLFITGHPSPCPGLNRNVQLILLSFFGVIFNILSTKMKRLAVNIIELRKYSSLFDLFLNIFTTDQFQRFDVQFSRIFRWCISIISNMCYCCCCKIWIYMCILLFYHNNLYVSINIMFLIV